MSEGFAPAHAPSTYAGGYGGQVAATARSGAKRANGAERAAPFDSLVNESSLRTPFDIARFARESNGAPGRI
jgi:hypothetical protein